MSTFAKSPVAAAAAAAVALIIATALVGGVVARPDPSTLTGASAPFNATDYGCPTWKLYKQCDSSWANDPLGTSSSETICTAGCAMSSTAMYLSTRGASENPGSLNKWLTDHNGYADGDLIIWGSVDAFGETNFISVTTEAMDTLVSGVAACHGLIANVRDGTHWVLLTGYAGDSSFYVNDPGFSSTQYSYSDMGQIAIYHPK